MPTLVLLRHAKSDYPPGVADHDRPLSARGRRDAARAGQLLGQLVAELPSGIARFDAVLVSSALRARQTWQLVAPTVPASEAVTSDHLYLAPAADLIDVVSGLPEPAEAALLVGHNEGLEECAAALSGTDVTLKTATYAVLSADIPWSLWRPEAARLDTVVAARG